MVVIDDELLKKQDNLLIDADVIKSIEDFSENQEMSEAILRSILERPVNLKLNDLGELYAITPEGETVVFDPKAKKLPELTNYIPDCPIDLQCGGKRSMQQESDACWKLIMINAVTEGLYTKDIKGILEDGYDYVRLKGKDGAMPFFNLLDEVLKYI